MAPRFPLFLLTFLLLLTGCPSEPPTLLPIGNREVRVGQTLEIIVAAQSSGNRTLEFTADNMPVGASFTQFAPTQARFTWSPTAADIGDLFVDFHVHDGKFDDSEKVIISVLGETDDGPSFVGQSTWTLEVGQKSIERIIEVRDTAAATIDWRIDNAPAGSTFTPLFRQAVFFWEPTSEQRSTPQYSFTVTAANEHGQSANQVFTILVRDAGGGDECPASKPTVDSATPSSMQGANDFEVTAVAYDAVGFIRSVTLRWSDLEDPAPSDYRPVLMSAGASDTYRADVHLTEDLEPGSYVTISYVICAIADHGDGCEQESCTQRLSFTAQRRGGGGLCSECSSSFECGSENDHCLPGLRPGEKFCAVDCRATGTCPSGYHCVDVSGDDRQCVPLTGTCQVSEFRPAKPGDIVINEILPAPPIGVDVNGDGVASTRGDEFVEIVSVTNEAVDIGNFTISDRIQVRYTFPMGTVLPPGGAIVVFGGGNPVNFTTDFGGAQAFSVLPGDPEGHGLVLRDAGDEVIVRDPDFGLIAAAAYGDLSGVPAASRYSLSLEPQAEGIVHVPTPQAQGSTGLSFAPGKQYCGKSFPIAVHGGCGGRVCGDRSPDTDEEPNNDRAHASCISDSVAEIQGNLTYHGTNSGTHPGPDPVDYYVFFAEQGEKVDVVTFPCDGTNSVQDTYVEVLDATGRVVAENDDHEASSPLLYAEIEEFPIPATGTYYVLVRTYQGNTDDTGCYLLWVMLSR